MSTKESDSATQLTPEDSEFCQRELARMLETHPGLLGALIASVDGHVVAAKLPAGSRDSDLAAMSSSMVGLAETVAQRTGVAPCNNLVVDNDGGHMVLMRVNQSLMLTVMGDKGTNVGMQLSAARICVTAINEAIR